MQHKESYRSTEKGNGEGKCGPFTLEACGGGTGLESQHLTRGAGTWNTLECDSRASSAPFTVRGACLTPWNLGCDRALGLGIK